MRQTTQGMLFRKAKDTCRRSNRTLYMLTYLFPKEKRAPTFFLYYYFSTIDDMVDENGLSKSAILRLINNKRKRMNQLFSGIIPKNMDDTDIALYNFIGWNPVVAAGVRPHLEKLLDVIEFDSKHKNRTISYKDMINYCHMAGGSPFFIFTSFIDQRINAATKEKIAYTFGTGIQLTNNLRDFVEDSRMRSAKITSDETAKFHLNNSIIENNSELKEFARQRAEEAEQFLNMGRKYIKEAPSLTLKFSLAIWRWRYLYILKKIQMRDYDLFADYKKSSLSEIMASVLILSKELSFAFKAALKP
ncbi:MAG: squalene/phytoene synthase family protein [Candidatus Aenigmarchaeota archaeon]|nr:squalene/phytoene synthase family protein [Candidatus Aenigmarchaeota archaeon]